MTMAGPSLKGKEIMQLEEDPLPTCTCMEEYIHQNLIHRAFETLVTSLRARFQENEPHIFQGCYHILQRYTAHEMGGREAFDRLTCILGNEADFLKEATEVFALYMSVEEWLMRQLDIHPIDGLTVHKILDFYGL
jgi:hypothetical protein